METSVAVLVDAKREYTNQLIQAIRPFLLSGMLSIYDEAFNVCQQNKEPDLAMLTFQELVGEIPKWNNKLVVEETERIVKESECDFLEELVTAVFVTHTKILTTVRITNKDRKVNLKVPCVENFVHQVYIEMAREFWKHPYLLNPLDVSKLQYQQNLKEAENIIHQCLETTIRRLLPVKDILKEYLVEGEADDELDDEFTATNDTRQNTPPVSPSVSTARPALSQIAGGNKTLLTQPTKTTNEAEKKEETKQHDKRVGGTDTKATLQKQLSTLTKDLTVQKETPSLLSGTNPTSGPTRDSFAQELAKIEKTGVSALSLSPAVSSPTNIKTVTTDSAKSLSGVTSLIGGGTSNGSIGTAPTTGIIKPVAIKTASPVVATSPVSTPTPAVTALSLDSLTGGGGLVASSSPKSPSSPTKTTSEISLDSLGSMEEVHVNFGRPSTIKSDVMNELNTITATAPPPAPALAPALAPAPAPAPFQFF